MTTLLDFLRTAEPVGNVWDYVSASRLNLWSKCPLAFRRRYVVGRRLFRNDWNEPMISAPARVLARDVDSRERLHVFMPLIEGWRQYGLACVGLDVQAAIAESYISRNRYKASPAIQLAHRNEMRDLTRSLSESELRDCYADLSSMRMETDGSPIYDDRQARRRIRCLWEKMTESVPNTKPVHGNVELPEEMRLECASARYPQQETPPNPISPEQQRALDKTARKLGYITDSRLNDRYSRLNRTFPKDPVDNISLNPSHWSETFPLVGPLRQWADCHAASQACHFVSDSDSALSHNVFPYFKSLIAEFSERFRLPLLEARENRRFLILRVRDIDLLCYLRTHNELEYFHSTGNPAGLRELRRLVGDHAENASTVENDWNLPAGVSEFLSSSAENDGTPCSQRVLPNEACFSRDYWEAGVFYRDYDYFSQPQEERDRFLAAILEYDQDDFFSDNQRLICKPADGQEKNFHAVARHVVRAWIHGWPEHIVVSQLQELWSGRSREDYPITAPVADLYRTLANHFRFRAQIGDFINGTLLPKLCIDPVVRLTVNSTDHTKELRLDQCWREIRYSRPVDDPFARDGIKDIQTRKLVRGDNMSREEERERWQHFLLPLLQDRCASLGIKSISRRQSLFERLCMTNAISRNGKSGRPIDEAEKACTCWMETLDDLKKAVVYALIRLGYNLVAVSADSFIVEVASALSPDDERQIVEAVQRSCEQILGIPADSWGRFVEHEFSSAWPVSPLPTPSPLASFRRQN